LEARVGIEPTHKGFAVFMVKRKSLRKHGHFRRMHYQNSGSFSTHLPLIGSLTAARNLNLIPTLFSNLHIPASAIIPPFLLDCV